MCCGTSIIRPKTRQGPSSTAAKSGRVSICEEEGDNPKILGVYSTRERAEDRVGRARLLPGFRDEPDCFLVDGYELDTDEWSEGYQIVYPT